MKKKITLQISIISIYISTFVVLFLILIIFGTINFKNSISYVANTLLDNVSHLVLRELARELTPAETMARLTQSLFANEYISKDDIDDYTLYIAKNLPKLNLPHPASLTTWGDIEGNGIETSLEPNGTYSSTIIRPGANPPFHIRQYRDQTDKIIHTVNLPINYDPRTRPWYIAAVNAKKFIWTDFFLAYPYKNPSVAAVVPVYDKLGKLLGVFEIETKLVGISNFLSTLNIGEDGVAFIINAKNELVAFPGMKQGDKNSLALFTNSKPWLNEALLQNNKKVFSYTYAGKIYLAFFATIPQFSAYGWKIGVVVPESSFTAVLQKNNMLLALVALIILILGILGTIFFSARISAPIKLLVKETKKIKHMHLQGGKAVDSIITEISLLANALYSMKINLRSFQKYMPATLVRQLIQSGKDIKLGGTKKELTILFTDIKNFTTISEATDPEQLMLHLGEYFEILSKIILEEQGTIDKYIGDSIMAFWGDPLFDKNHCLHACNAALKCRNEIHSLNSWWQQQGKSIFITRFGLHTGNAIVGNIGSSERLNYTALGDSVNLASRLEGLNKLYGTDIIVSEAVVNAVGKHFVFRMLDRIAVKGKTDYNTIFELLALNKRDLSFDFSAYQQHFSEGFAAYIAQQWNVAINHFKKCLSVFPEDTVTKVFLARIALFEKNPPASNWDGIWRISE